MKIIKFLLIVILFVPILLSCKKSIEEKPKEEAKETAKSTLIKLTEEAVREIKLEISEVKEGELTGAISAPARILPNQDLEAYIGSLVQGRVSKVFVNIGDNVKKGQVLMYIEGLQIGEIKAAFLKAKANLDYAESNYNRLKTLIEQNVGAQKTFLEAKFDFERAKAEFNAEDKKIHSIGLNDNEILEANGNDEHKSGLLAVRAPIDGTIVERNAVIGQLIEPNSNSFRIINTNSLLVDGQIYENELNRIAGKPDITLSTTAYPDINFKGKIIYISDVLEKDSRTFKIRASVINQERKLRPEMFALMHIPTAKPAKALLVPAEAVVKDGKDNYVFIAVNDTTFEKRDVVTGSTEGDFVEIKNGINGGEKVVSKGSFMLKSEMKKETLEAGD